MCWQRMGNPSSRCFCAVLLDYGDMDAESLLAESEAAASERLQLRVRSGARRGEPEMMNQVRPCSCDAWTSTPMLLTARRGQRRGHASFVPTC